ncbi:oxidoreductase [Chondromyces crocatus]|uniref:Oxidoreductase n=1 Tax=Chondromyces crocatus TaxID=52 RepID=A0A0K1E7E9_CHOCO|nr:oxidoreductase [Chondromyces crocatus]
MRVGLIGCGVWGENLLRVLSCHAQAEVVVVADPNAARLERVRYFAPSARRVPSLDEALAAQLDAVVIATPPTSHAELTLRALDAGVDVLVEKPLALAPEDAERCAARAEALGRVAMVGHLLRYHPAVTTLAELCGAGELGEVERFSATRRSARALAGSADPHATLWALGPHDLAVLGALDPTPARSVVASVRGASITVAARLASGTQARISLCRSSPTKERWTRVMGSRRVAWFDEVQSPESVILATTRGSSLLTEDPLIIEREIRLPSVDPLAVEISHFLDCVENRTPPLTPLTEGVTVVRALARAERALTAQTLGAMASPA